MLAEDVRMPIIARRQAAMDALDREVANGGLVQE